MKTQAHSRITLPALAIFFTLGLMAQSAAAQTEQSSTPESTPDTVYVAAPTGEKETDRASILAALEKVQPGGTVQFAPGMYLVGELIRVTVPGITLQGHPDGTTLRGCDPADLPELSPASCDGMFLGAARQTVRGLTFEHAYEWLYVGCCMPPDLEAAGPDLSHGLGHPGGHLVEGNTFRNSNMGIRVWGQSAEPIVVRRNRFVNTFHAIAISGGEVHFLANDVSVPEPGAVPRRGYPGYAIALAGTPLLPPAQRPHDHASCARNIVEGNRIEGHPDGILISTDSSWSSCVGNVIRDNTIIVQRTRAVSPPPGIRLIDESDSTVVGTPLVLGSPSGEGAFEDNLIEGNRIIGAEGIGIEVRNASRNRIVNNTITGVLRRQPFPGNWMYSDPQAWRDANGSGIWVSPGSDENEIVGNTFENIASHAVVLEGDRNSVETRSASDVVRDLGSGNRVSVIAADSVDAFIRERMASLGIPGVSLAVLRGAEVIKAAAYGRSSLELDVPTSAATLFPYASMTKAVTGTAILRLVERGQLSLDDRIGDLLPELPETWSGVSVRRLLSHTSGLPDVALPESDAGVPPYTIRQMVLASTVDSAMAALSTLPLQFAPGDSAAYNQTNYILLAMLLQRIDGRTIEDYVREEFAMPLGLSSFAYGDSRVVVPGRASWYTRFDFSSGRPEPGEVRPVWLEYPEFLHTGAGLNGSAVDLARFIAAVASGDLLGEASRREMWGAAVLNDGTRAREGPFVWGLGWLVGDQSPHPYVGMGGAGSGAFRHFVNDDLTVVVLTNLQGANPFGLVEGVAGIYMREQQ